MKLKQKLKQFFCGLFNKHNVKLVVSNIEMDILSTTIQTIKCVKCGKVFAIDAHTTLIGDGNMKAPDTKCNKPKPKPKK
jgi:hypothetical protein